MPDIKIVMTITKEKENSPKYYWILSLFRINIMDTLAFFDENVADM